MQIYVTNKGGTIQNHCIELDAVPRVGDRLWLNERYWQVTQVIWGTHGSSPHILVKVERKI